MLNFFRIFEKNKPFELQLMRKILYIIGLSVFVSCASQQPTKNTTTNPKPTTVTTAPKPTTPTYPKPITIQGVEFYTTNIADITKNDNTISYGSIVSAKPAGYKVVKTYFPAIGQNFRQKYLILHYTALDDDKSLTVLTQQSVSSHYLVNNLGNNEIYQLVDENKRAYHAGNSSWRSDKMLNDTSIGIEIVNNGYTTDSIGNRVFVAFEEAQIKKVAALAKDIVTRYNIPPTNVLAHSDIAPLRKQDPGPLFPWKRLYEQYQIGMWYDEAVKQNFMSQLVNTNFEINSNTSAMIIKIQAALNQLGYDISPSGTWDTNNRKVVEAFQFHFRPEKFDGIVDAETWAILQALNQKYPLK